MNKCPNCGNVLDTGDIFCTNCGTKIADSVICPNCKRGISSSADFCTFCGYSINGSDKDRVNCPKCGNKVDLNDKFCTNCGFDLTRPLNNDDGFMDYLDSLEIKDIDEFIDNAQKDDYKLTSFDKLSNKNLSSSNIHDDDLKNSSSKDSHIYEDGLNLQNSSKSNGLSRNMAESDKSYSSSRDNGSSIISDTGIDDFSDENNMQQNSESNSPDEFLTKCPRCNKTVKADSIYCTDCGSVINPTLIKKQDYESKYETSNHKHKTNIISSEDMKNKLKNKSQKTEKINSGNKSAHKIKVLHSNNKTYNEAKHKDGTVKIASDNGIKSDIVSDDKGKSKDTNHEVDNIRNIESTDNELDHIRDNVKFDSGNSDDTGDELDYNRSIAKVNSGNSDGEDLDEYGEQYSSADELLKWYDIYQKGIISEEEFEIKKNILLRKED